MSRRKIDATAFAKPNFAVEVPRPPDRTEVGDEVINRWVEGMPAEVAKAESVPEPGTAAEPVPSAPASKVRAARAKVDKVAAISTEKPVSRLRREERGEKLTIWLPPELATELRVACAMDRVAQSIAVEEALKLWLQNRR